MKYAINMKCLIFRITGNRFFILFAFLIICNFISCSEDWKSENPVKSISYYPSQSYYKESDSIVPVTLDDFSDYISLMEFINQTYCSGKKPVLIVEDADDIYKFILLNGCPQPNVVACYRERNIVELSPDSVTINGFKNQSIERLPEIMEKHILNNGKDYSFSDKPELASFIVYPEENSKLADMKELLLNIAISFDKLNNKNGSELELKISMFRKNRVPPPPPPPPVIDGN